MCHVQYRCTYTSYNCDLCVPCPRREPKTKACQVGRPSIERPRHPRHCTPQKKNPVFCPSPPSPPRPSPLLPSSHSNAPRRGARGSGRGCSSDSSSAVVSSSQGGPLHLCRPPVASACRCAVQSVPACGASSILRNGGASTAMQVQRCRSRGLVSRASEQMAKISSLAAGSAAWNRSCATMVMARKALSESRSQRVLCFSIARTQRSARSEVAQLDVLSGFVAGRIRVSAVYGSHQPRGDEPEAVDWRLHAGGLGRVQPGTFFCGVQ